MGKHKFNAPDDLFDKIMARIHKEEKMLVIKRRIVLFSLSILFSGAAIMPIFNMVWKGFIESGFFKFLSLIISDTGIVILYWQEFTMSLLESLPISGLILLSFVILAFLESLKLLTKNLRIYGYK